MNQNLSSYRIFYTVANTGNISKAAKELYISPVSYTHLDVYKRQEHQHPIINTVAAF